MSLKIFCLGTAFVILGATNLRAVVRYVDANGVGSMPPYTNWSTAATAIQDAIDVADPGDQILVTNGIYQTGGRPVYGSLTNRVSVDKPVFIHSVNGPDVTVIAGFQVPGTTNGDSAVRCVYLTNDAVLAGFTLTNGGTRMIGNDSSENKGAGVWCESSSAIVSNCVIVGNAAITDGWGLGGGVWNGTLYECTLIRNYSCGGGGAYNAILNSCTLQSNVTYSGFFATFGGGASYCSLNDCTVSGNVCFSSSSFPSSGGGASHSTLNGCALFGNSAGSGGGASGCTLDDCSISNNVATANSSFASSGQGGGAYGSTLNGCSLYNNSAVTGGGGAGSCTLNDCLLAGNSTRKLGGGVYSCGVSNSVITGNTATSGGGANGGTLIQCTISQNVALSSGGGAEAASLNNCAIFGNSARATGGLVSSNAGRGNGGGVNACTLNNCTVTGNSALYAGGADSSFITNCIIYYNSAPVGNGYTNGSLTFSCTTPLPPSGSGNITNEPQLADFYHLSGGSACRQTGSPAYTTGLDIDGETWSDPPSVGCDEYVTGSITGSLSVAVGIASTNVATGFAADLIAQINGHAAASRWDFGDGTVLSNRPYASHSWSAAGNYLVQLWAYNESNASGVSAIVSVHVVDNPVHYVAANVANPVAPYLSWETAAASIQDAVDAAFLGSSVVVTNGIYNTGGRIVNGMLSNRVAVTKPISVRSVNGPGTTTIRGQYALGTTNGDSAVRCVYLTNGAALVGFTLTNGATRTSGNDWDMGGGGAWCESTNGVLSNCVIVANSAAGWGAGTYFGTLDNCTITNNQNYFSGSIGVGPGGGGGGGAYRSSCNNCFIAGNAANFGGGVHDAILNCCVVASNSAVGAAYSSLNNCLVVSNYSGGTYICNLYNCTVSGNTTRNTSFAGGASLSTLKNCIVYHNITIFGGPTNYGSCNFTYSCTTPAAAGVGNVTNAPLFVDRLAGNFRLQSNSPCINAGRNANAAAGMDLDGNPRIVGYTVDVGAYEFQSPASVISYAWLQRYGLATDGSVDYLDADGDRMNNWQEWQADTIPTNGQSNLRITSIVSNPPDWKLTWQSVPTRTYFVDHATNLGIQTSFVTIATNIPGQSGTTFYTDAGTYGPGPSYYRVGVRP